MKGEKKSIEARRKDLRERLQRREKLIMPGVYDALTARIVQEMGFSVLYLGGYTTGAHLATTEPLLTLTEQISVASWIVKAVDLPLIVDGDAGFGDILHTIRTVQEFEHAGVAGIHLEDQFFPKRASYHKGLEHIIPLEDFEQKIRYALEARRDPNFLILGRTDAARAVEGSYEELVRRSRALIKWGVDILIPFPSSNPPMDMVRKFRKDVPDDIPCLILGGQDLPAEEYWNMGYNLVVYHLIGIFAAARAVQKEFQNIKEKGKWTLSAEEYGAARRLIEESISLPEYYQIEEKTTEKKK
jgi:2-methylisocitrate lyase-like PEP mutase family enzyme